MDSMNERMMFSSTSWRMLDWQRELPNPSMAWIGVKGCNLKRKVVPNRSLRILTSILGERLRNMLFPKVLIIQVTVPKAGGCWIIMLEEMDWVVESLLLG